MTVDLAATEAVVAVWLPAFLAGARAPLEHWAAAPVTWDAASGMTMAIDPTREDASWARLVAAVPDARREDVRVEVFAGGWVLQATTVGTVDGVEARLAVCLVARLDDEGRLARFEQYADAAAAAPFLAALARPNVKGDEDQEHP